MSAILIRTYMHAYVSACVCGSPNAKPNGMFFIFAAHTRIQFLFLAKQQGHKYLVYISICIFIYKHTHRCAYIYIYIYI